jgi:hypothetical protein
MVIFQPMKGLAMKVAVIKNEHCSGISQTKCLVQCAIVTMKIHEADFNTFLHIKTILNIVLIGCCRTK